MDNLSTAPLTALQDEKIRAIVDALTGQDPTRAAYKIGFIDGAQTVVRNVLLSLSPQAAYAFIQAASDDYGDRIRGFAVGVFDRDLYVWTFIDDVDLDLTKDLFRLKSAIEQSEHGRFEVHVKPRQGREIEAVLPAGFQLVRL
jgi:hypothetical protein